MIPGQADNFGSAFAPLGNTQAASVTTANTALTFANGVRQILITNLSTNPMFWCSGPSPCVAPVPGTPGNGTPVPAGSASSFTVPPGTTTINLIALVAGPSLAYVTPGEGE